MPKPDGTMYPWERAEWNSARARYHPKSTHIYEALEKKAFADLMAVTAKYAGYK